MIIDGKELFVFDTEDNSKGKLYWIVFYNGRKFYVFKDRKAADDFIINYKDKALCWAVNLEYDVINTFRESFAKLRWIFGKSRLISIRYKKWLFYDTLNHWKMSVKEMGEYIKFKKAKFNPQSLEYCKQDCRVEYAFVKKMILLYQKIGLPIKSTLPSSVYKYWFDKYSPQMKVLETPVLDKFRKAYYGGRTECFYIGKVKPKAEELIYSVDVNSLYPSVMIREYPYPYDYEETRKADLDSYGITHCRVKVKSDLPVLPYRAKDGRLLFPNGTFEGSWSNAELKYSGAKILRVYKSWKFPLRCYPFRGYVNYFYERRQKAKKDKLLNMLYKLSLNSLYGKFGQGKERSNIISYINYVKNQKKLYSDDINIYGDIVIYTTSKKYPINTNMVWALYTTAYARIELHKWLKYIRDNKGKILYCDTDSIFYLSKKKLIKTSKDLGAFKDEGTYKNLEIKLPKLYHLGSKYRAKGVPKDKQEKFFESGFVEYDRPVKFKESLQRNLTANVWFKDRKQSNSLYNKGNVLSSGDVIPLTINV